MAEIKLVAPVNLTMQGQKIVGVGEPTDPTDGARFSDLPSQLIDLSDVNSIVNTSADVVFDSSTDGDNTSSAFNALRLGGVASGTLLDVRISVSTGGNTTVAFYDDLATGIELPLTLVNPNDHSERIDLGSTLLQNTSNNAIKFFILTGFDFTTDSDWDWVDEQDSSNIGTTDLGFQQGEILIIGANDLAIASTSERLYSETLEPYLVRGDVDTNALQGPQGRYTISIFIDVTDSGTPATPSTSLLTTNTGAAALPANDATYGPWSFNPPLGATVTWESRAQVNPSDFTGNTYTLVWSPVFEAGERGSQGNQGFQGDGTAVTATASGVAAGDTSSITFTNTDVDDVTGVATTSDTVVTIQPGVQGVQGESLEVASSVVDFGGTGETVVTLQTADTDTAAGEFRVPRGEQGPQGILNFQLFLGQLATDDLPLRNNSTQPLGFYYFLDSGVFSAGDIQIDGPTGWVDNFADALTAAGGSAALEAGTGVVYQSNFSINPGNVNSNVIRSTWVGTTPFITGLQGPIGDPGPGLPDQGTAGQIITKVDATDYNTQWSSLDTTPTASSTLPVESGGVLTAINTAISGLSTVYATAAQGLLADSALQSADVVVTNFTTTEEDLAWTRADGTAVFTITDGFRYDVAGITSLTIENLQIQDSNIASFDADAGTITLADALTFGLTGTDLDVTYDTGDATSIEVEGTTHNILDPGDLELTFDSIDGNIGSDQFDNATNTALALAITAVQPLNVSSSTVDFIPLTANRANPSDIDLTGFDSQAFGSIDTTAEPGTPFGSLAYLNASGVQINPGVAWSGVGGILAGADGVNTLPIFFGNNQGMEFMIVEDDENWAIFTSIANTTGNEEDLALIAGEFRGITREAAVTLYKGAAGSFSSVLGTTEFVDSAISQVGGIPTSSATVPADSDDGTLATTGWVRDITDEKADTDHIGIIEIAGSDNTFESTDNYTFSDNSNEFTFNFTTPDSATFSVEFTAETGFIASFGGTSAEFQSSEWTLGYRATTDAAGSAATAIDTAVQGSHTGNFSGTFTLTDAVTSIAQNTEYTFVLTPGVTGIVVATAPEGYSIRIHETYAGAVQVRPGTRDAIDDIADDRINRIRTSSTELTFPDGTTFTGGGSASSLVPTPDPESSDGANDSDDVGKYILVDAAGDYHLPDITFAQGVRNLIDAEGPFAERPVADPTSANSVIQYATDGTPTYTTIPAGSTVDQTFDPASANPQSGTAVQEAMEIEVGIRTNPSSTGHTRLQHEVTITGDTTVDSGEDYTAPSPLAVDADIDVTIRIDVESFSSLTGVLHVDLTSSAQTDLLSVATFNISDLGPIVTNDFVIDGDDLVAGATYDVVYRTVGHGVSDSITFISSVDFEFDSGGLFVKPEVDEYVNGLITTATAPLATNNNLENNYLTSAEIGEHYLSGRVGHNDGTLILSNGFNPDDTDFFGSHDAFVADGGDRVQVGLAFANGSVREQDLHNGRIFLIQFSNTAGDTSSIIYRARVYFNLVGFPGQPIEIFANLIDSDNNLIGPMDAVSSTDTTTVFAALTALAADTSGEPRFNAAQVELSLDLASGEPTFTPSTGLSIDRLNGFEPQGGTFASKFSLFFGTPSAGAEVTVSAVGGDVMRTPEVYTTNGINWYWWSDLTISGSDINVSTTNAGLWTDGDDPDTATIRFNLIG